jgi:hypothetical protein
MKMDSAVSLQSIESLNKATAPIMFQAIMNIEFKIMIQKKGHIINRLEAYINSLFVIKNTK